MAGEQPKKATGGAFGQYLSENRAALLKELPGQRATAAVKLASERFKLLDAAAKAKYQKMYEAAKEKYAADLKAYLEAGGEMKARKTKKEKKAKSAKDPNKPKRPAGGAFGCFLTKKRADFMKELGPGKSVAAITKLASERWGSLSDTDKVPFQKEYEKKAEEYKKAMQSYVPPAGEVGGDDAENEEDQEEGEEEEGEDEKQEPDEEFASPPVKRQAAADDAPAAKKGRMSAELSEVEIEAKKLGYLPKLKALTENPKVKASPATILAELQKQNGGVVAARKALLGA